MSMDVSIIVPCYNASEFLPETIESVFQQSLENWELILVNDGSTDQTDELIKSYVDPRIKYIKKGNTGVSDSRNKGFQIASGKYVTFLDSDDILEPDCLALRKNLMEQNPGIQAVHSSVIIWNSETGEMAVRESKGGKLLDSLLEFKGNIVQSPSSAMMSKIVMEQVGGFDTRLSTSADWDMWVRLSALTEFGYIEKPLLKYRVHSGQMHKNIELMESDMLLAFHKAKSNGIFKSSKYYRYCRAKLSLVLAGSFWKHSSHKGKAIKHIATSFFLNPIHVIKKVF